MTVYERTIGASLERIWENVLDWEHLPWLHRSSFSDIRLLEGSRDGWRAVVASAGRGADRESTIHVELERFRRRYLTRTIAGAGEGMEILTSLEPKGERETAIHVEFRLPEMAPALARKVGASLVELYRRLWDEDEGMMIRRQRLLDDEQALRRRAPDPEPIRLGSVARLRSGLPMTVEVGGRSYRLVALDGEIVAHSTVCPHRGGPLEAAAVEEGCITCPWHGYRYDLRTGRSLGPADLVLDRAPRVVIDRESDDAILVFGKPA